MARQTDSEITGTIGNIIFYERNGEYLMRTVQVQTAATRKAAKEYGRASNKAKTVRQLLSPLIPEPKDRDMQNRLVPAMRELLALLNDAAYIQPDRNPLAGFRIVGGSDLKSCLLFQWAFTQLSNGNISMELPAINPVDAIAAPPGASRVELKLIAVALGLNDEQTYAGSPEIITIPYTDDMQPPRNLILEMPAKAGSLVIVAAALSYWNGDQQISKEGFTPVEIVGVFKSL